ncbi:hypothetical protein [Desulforamulus reducens]|uniref:hypothetical protein n=1 Tax=Desulforamulus reducens TaxID=59610 RepID=UPI0002D71B2B|nr:hypothetical protein [Desulforamulus reducens]
MRRNINSTERLLNVLGGIAFTGLGRSENYRKSWLGKSMTLLGIKSTAVGVLGYNPLIDWLEQDDDDDFF